MKPFKLIYASLRPCDFFFSHSNRLTGRIIRFAERIKFAPKDDHTPTHGGIITSDCGQLFATEMKPRLVENSLEKYTGRREQLVEVWRLDCLTIDQRTEIQVYLATLRRKNRDLKYDLFGAIISSPLGRKLFPFAKNNPRRFFCSENQAHVIRKFYDHECPVAPDPLALSFYFKTKPLLYNRVTESEWKGKRNAPRRNGP